MDHKKVLSESINNLTQYIPIIQNPDGSITRLEQVTISIPADPNSSSAVLTKDVTFNTQNNTSIRLYLPRNAHDSSFSKPPTKLPLIVYFHGGGFIICKPGFTYFHNLCYEMASRLGIMIASVDYRLAPEHRLPSAYDDAMDALHWIKSLQDDWLRDFVDLSNCFLMGDSAGGNIAYNAGLRAAAEVDDLVPLMIRGLILHQPFLGGVERTVSELRGVDDRILPLLATDILWDLALPIGCDRDHVYSNPTVDGEILTMCALGMKSVGWRVLVTGCDGDPLIDRQMELAEKLKMNGVDVEIWRRKDGYHGVDFIEPDKVESLFPILKSFIKL
ncbi:carboxylesterase 1-like [Impatiens glandulifera]|uniref:carboxylesterase 1-like n=1 Tax=Impatiens glandulifera TaxID=253017 RepID=UPI001FB0AB31|nr:carboxylesterase 1-like [Impatiens glandulifera]